MTSRLPKLHLSPLGERKKRIADALGVSLEALEAALGDGGLAEATADKLVENVVGTYALPLGFATSFVVDGREVLVPMAIEEPSVIAAASAAAKIVGRSGGFESEADAPVTIAQLYIENASGTSLQNTELVLTTANAAVPGLVERGGGAVGVETTDLGDGVVRVHVLVDSRDAMGANLADTVAEAVAPVIEAQLGGRALLRILSNLGTHRLVRARATIRDLDPEVRDAIVRAQRIAERDPYRAATHNKGILNGIDAVTVATGNDWRAVEAGAHAYAARGNTYQPLTRWRVEADALIGELEMPLALGIVGGTLRAHRAARFAIAATGIERGVDLARIAACAGLATNFAALRALVTEGIQAGHMRLQARSVALSVGARDEEIDEVARRISAAGTVNEDAARTALRDLRS